MGSPAQTTPVVFQRMTPVLAVRDLDEAVAWYRDGLGFALAWKWGTPPVRAGVMRDNQELQLVSNGVGAPPGPSRVYFIVSDVDGFHEQCLRRNVAIAMDLADRPFGVRDFRVEDPSGNYICFGQLTDTG